MNVLQIMRQARFEIDAIRTGNVVSQMWQDEEVLKAVNIAMDRAARLLRLSHSNLLTKSLLTTQGQDFIGVTAPYQPDQQIEESYNPTSMQIKINQSDYLLPADFVRVESMRALTTGFEGVKFHPSDPNNKMFLSQRSINIEELPSANNSDQEFWYIILGPRTIRFAPMPNDRIDIELIYHYRPARLNYYNTGTVIRTNTLSIVTGTGTTWLTSGIRPPADLLVGMASVNGVDMNAYYPFVRTINSDTSLNLSRAATLTDGVGQAYYLAMTPALPEEHHSWLAQLTAAILLRKVDVDMSSKFQADLGQQLLEAVLPEVTLRQLQESIITEAFELPS